MKTLFQAIAAASIFFTASASAQKTVPSIADPLPASAAPAAVQEPTTIYRQVMPDGRIVYSDKLVPGGKVDNKITLEPAIKGNLWTTQPGPKPVIAPQIEFTPIVKVATPPLPPRRKMLEESTSEVIRAEMLLEDAKRRQKAGVEPMPAERSGDGSRLNPAYESRQQYLARDVAYAESVLKKAVAERDALR